MLNNSFVWTSKASGGSYICLVDEIRFEDIKTIYVCKNNEKKIITKEKLFFWFNTCDFVRYNNLVWNDNDGKHDK